jgi:ABC-type multidrug transport system fused ATPase/permease subunit
VAAPTEVDPPIDAVPGRRARRQPAWRLLLAHISPHRWTLLGGGALGFLGGLAALAQPMVAKLVVDNLGQHRSLAGPVALLTALAVGGALLNAAGTYLLGRAAESVVLSARHGLISQLLRLRVGALDHLEPGDLLSRVTSDTTLLRSVSTYGLVHSINAAFLLVGSAVLMATLDLVLLLVTLAGGASRWLDSPDGGLDRARRPGVVPGRAGRRRGAGGYRSVAGVFADRFPAVPVPADRPDQLAD